MKTTQTSGKTGGKAAAKPKAKRGAPADPAAAEAEVPPPATGNDLRKKALIEAVAAETGVKRGTVKNVVEATLGAIGAALSRGDGLNLAPLGKARVNRQKEKGEGEVLVVRLRRGKGGGEADEGLADSGD